MPLALGRLEIDRGLFAAIIDLDFVADALVLVQRLHSCTLDGADMHEYVGAAVIGTGFIGTPALLPALIKIGEPDLAAAVFLQEEVPGWLAQVKRGATTIWERWDAIREDGSIFEPKMNSYNHYAYGAVCQWLFESVAGFRPDPGVPGFKHIIFEPTIIPQLSPVKADHDSAAGRSHGALKRLHERHAARARGDQHVKRHDPTPRSATARGDAPSAPLPRPARA